MVHVCGLSLLFDGVIVDLSKKRNRFDRYVKPFENLSEDELKDVLHEQKVKTPFGAL